MRRWKVLIIHGTAWLLLSQIVKAGPKGQEGGSGPVVAKAPKSARIRTNPYEGNPMAHQAGKKLFQRHCAGCHEKDVKGRPKAPNLQSPSVQEAPPGVLFWFIKNGNLRKGMPSWARLPEQRLWQIVTYLKSKS